MQRFSTASEADLTKLSKPFVLKKTEDATAWSLRNFHCWLNNRNSQGQLEKCPQNLLEEMTSNYDSKIDVVFLAGVLGLDSSIDRLVTIFDSSLRLTSLSRNL